jgi:hypothetical protein
VQNDLSLTRSVNGESYVNVWNANTGTSASSSFYVGNNNAQIMGGVSAFSSNLSTGSVANHVGLTTGNFNIVIGTNLNVASGGTSIIKFMTGGSNAAQERMRIFSTGNLGINTTTDAGFRLDVNGTARVSGALTLGTGTAVASSISYGTTYGVTIWGNTGSNSDLLLTDRGGNLRFRIVNGGNILQTSSVINDISIGTTAVAKSIVADATYGMTVRGGVGSVFNLSLVENTGNNGIFIDSSGNAKVGVYNSTYNSSAILEAVSTTKGFLPPRMTTTQRNAIASPAAGLIVYDTTLNLPHFFNGTIWVSL